MPRLRDRIDPQTSSFGLSIEFAGNLASIISCILPAVAAIYGGASATDSSAVATRTAEELQDASLAMRMLALVTVAAILGYGLGGVCYLLSRRNTGNIAVFQSILAIVWALFLVTAAQILADATSDAVLPEFTMFLLVGLGLCLWLLSFQMRAQTRVGTPAMVEDRSLVVLTFAATALIAGFVVELGAIA